MTPNTNFVVSQAGQQYDCGFYALIPRIGIDNKTGLPKQVKWICTRLWSSLVKHLLDWQTSQRNYSGELGTI
jgi:hypothetical protein